MSTQLNLSVENWLRKLVKFGTHDRGQERHETDEDAVFRVLNRQVPIAALEALISSMGRSQQDFSISSAVIALDTNVLLKLAGHRNSGDIIDYLTSRHEPPIVLPGQVITEFWNNQLAAVETVAKGLTSDFSNFRKRVGEIDEEFKKFSDNIDKMLAAFEEDHGNVYSGVTVRRTRGLLDAIRQRGIVPFVDRIRFNDLAEHRCRTKTPPGFEDVGHGDFFVWADFLLGLKVACSKDERWRHAIFVTNEKKRDWVRDDVAHPVLTAEATAVSGGLFAIWPANKLAKAIESVT